MAPILRIQRAQPELRDPQTNQCTMTTSLGPKAGRSSPDQWSLRWTHASDRARQQRSESLVAFKEGGPVNDALEASTQAIGYTGWA